MIVSKSSLQSNTDVFPTLSIYSPSSTHETEFIATLYSGLTHIILPFSALFLSIVRMRYILFLASLFFYHVTVR